MQRARWGGVVGLAILLGCEAEARRAPAAPGDPAPPGVVAVPGPDSAVLPRAAAAPAAPPGRGFRRAGRLVVVDTFEVHHRLRGDLLTLALETDLGDEAEVFVSVARSYRERGSEREYIIEYFNEAGTVGAWRAGRTIDLAATDFRAEVEKLRRGLALQGEPLDVASTSDELRIEFRVYPGQGPPFESGNTNLSGQAVTVRDAARVIEKSSRVRYAAPR